MEFYESQRIRKQLEEVLLFQEHAVSTLTDHILSLRHVHVDAPLILTCLGPAGTRKTTSASYFAHLVNPPSFAIPVEHLLDIDAVVSPYFHVIPCNQSGRGTNVGILNAIGEKFAKLESLPPAAIDYDAYDTEMRKDDSCTPPRAARRTAVILLDEIDFVPRAIPALRQFFTDGACGERKLPLSFQLVVFLVSNKGEEKLEADVFANKSPEEMDKLGEDLRSNFTKHVLKNSEPDASRALNHTVLFRAPSEREKRLLLEQMVRRWQDQEQRKQSRRLVVDDLFLECIWKRTRRCHSARSIAEMFKHLRNGAVAQFVSRVGSITGSLLWLSAGEREPYVVAESPVKQFGQPESDVDLFLKDFCITSPLSHTPYKIGAIEDYLVASVQRWCRNEPSLHGARVICPPDAFFLMLEYCKTKAIYTLENRILIPIRAQLGEARSEDPLLMNLLQLRITTPLDVTVAPFQWNTSERITATSTELHPSFRRYCDADNRFLQNHGDNPLHWNPDVEMDTSDECSSCSPATAATHAAAGVRTQVTTGVEVAAASMGPAASHNPAASGSLSLPETTSSALGSSSSRAAASAGTAAVSRAALVQPSSRSAVVSFLPSPGSQQQQQQQSADLGLKLYIPLHQEALNWRFGSDVFAAFSFKQLQDHFDARPTLAFCRDRRQEVYALYPDMENHLRRANPRCVPIDVVMKLCRKT